MPNRWFIVPVAGNGDRNDMYRPKYADTNGITDYSGHRRDFSASKWSDLPWYPNEMYVVRFYGTNKALNSVRKKNDAYGKKEYSLSDSEIAEYLNDKFGRSLTFSEWLNRFKVS